MEKIVEWRREFTEFQWGEKTLPAEALIPNNFCLTRFYNKQACPTRALQAAFDPGRL